MSGLITNEDLGLFKSLDEALEKTSKKMDGIIERFETFRQILDSDLKSKLEGIRKEVLGLSTDATSAFRQLGQLQKEVDKIKKSTSAYRTELESSVKTIKAYEKEVAKLKKELATLNKEKEAGTISTKKYDSGVANLTKRFSAAYLGANLVIKAINGLSRQVEQAFTSTLEFEKAMKSTEAITRATSSEILALTSNANKLGASTEYTAVQVANLQKELGKLGFSAAEVVQSTAAVTDLATATGEDLVAAGTVAASTLRQFGMDASQMTKVVDVMSGSFVRSALDLSKFRESMKMVGPIAKAANIDLETTTAILSRLADAGISGSLAGTSLRNILSRMADPTSKISKLLGGAVTNSEELVRAFERMKESGIGFQETIQLMDVRARPAFSLFLDQVSSVRALANEYRNVDGEGRKLADMMRDTLSNDLEILNSAFDSLRRTGMEEYESKIRSITQWTTKFTEGLRLLIAGKVEAVDFWTALSRSIGGFLFGLEDRQAKLTNMVRSAQMAEEYEQVKDVLAGVEQNAASVSDENLKLIKSAEKMTAQMYKFEEAWKASGKEADKQKFEMAMSRLQGTAEKVAETFGEAFTRVDADGNLVPLIGRLDAFVSKQKESFDLGVKAAKQQEENTAILRAELNRALTQKKEVYKEQEKELALLKEVPKQYAIHSKEWQDAHQAIKKGQQELNKNHEEQKELIAQLTLADQKLAILKQKNIKFDEESLRITSLLGEKKQEGAENEIQYAADYLKLREQQLRFDVENLNTIVTKEKMAFEEKLEFAEKLKDAQIKLSETTRDRVIRDAADTAKNENDRLTAVAMAHAQHKQNLMKAEESYRIFVENEATKRAEAEQREREKDEAAFERYLNRLTQMESEASAARSQIRVQKAVNDLEDMERELTRLSEFQLKKRHDMEMRAAELRRQVAEREKSAREQELRARMDAEERYIRQSQEFARASEVAQERMLDSLKDKYGSFFQYLDEEYKNIFKEIDFQAEMATQKIANTMAKAAGEFADAYGMIVNARMDRERQALQDQAKFINEWEKERVERAGDNEEARKMIEREAERRRKENDKQRAIAERERALFQIKMNTFQAIASALATGVFPANLINAGIVGAKGLLQYQLAKSQPLPKFEKGTNYSPEGPAIVSEKGPELVEEKSGRMWLTPEKESVVDLEKGSKVYPAHETEKILNGLNFDDRNAIANSQILSSVKGVKLDVEKIMDGFRNEIKNIPQTTINMDENGFTKSIRKNNRTTTYLNKRYGWNSN